MAGNSRSTGLEQFYTPTNAAKELTRFLIETVGVDTNVEWIEPAAGTGNFMKAMKDAGVSKITAYDIEPYNAGIVKADFLKQQLVTAKVSLTNPPFGRNNSLSIPFFNKLASSCDVIAFIVPRSWRKWSVVNRLDRNFVKIVDYDLKLNYVDGNGTRLTKSTSLNTVFQVWVRSDKQRALAPSVTPKSHFKTVKPTSATASLTQFGRGCGSVKTTFDKVPNTTQMFIDATPQVIKKLQSLDLSPFYTQTAYIEALSKVEINYALSELSKNVTIPSDFLVMSNLQSHPQYPIAKSLRTGSFDFTEIVQEVQEP
jgi:predicted RNA methylase